MWCLPVNALYTLLFTLSIKYVECVFVEKRVPLRLNYSKYGGQLTEDNLIRLAAVLFDYTTKEPTMAVRNIVLDNPEIKVRVSKISHNKRYGL